MASLTTSPERLGAALGQLSHAKANFLKNRLPQLPYEKGRILGTANTGGGEALRSTLVLERLRVLKPGLKLCTAEDRLRAQLQSPLACDGQRAAERYTDVEFHSAN